MNPVRLDPELWKPPLQWHPPTDHAAEDIYREYRAANRPFRRAFGGGEMRRKILMACGHATAQRKEAQS